MDHHRRFACLPRHKTEYQCEGLNVVRVENPQSVKSLPGWVKDGLKSEVIARQEDLDIAFEFLSWRAQLCRVRKNTEETVATAERPGMAKTLALWFSQTQGFKNPNQLLQVAVDTQEQRSLSSQTMLNYLTHLKKFAGYLDLHKNIGGHLTCEKWKTQFSTFEKLLGKALPGRTGK